MTYDAFIFDVDGVLLDTSQSFNQAVLLAVKIATGSSRFKNQHIMKLKSIPGFNNDWNVAIAGAAWIKYQNTILFNELADELNNFGGGLKALKKIIPLLPDSFQQSITRLVMEAYGGTSACQTLYGFEPETIILEGMWKNEIPLISPGIIDPYLPVSAIVSGRNKTEMELAFNILGWELPQERVTFSDIPEFDKPNPERLIHMIQKMKSNHPVFLGDSRDDLELVKNYIDQTGKILDFCCVGDENKIDEFDIQVQSVSEFFKIMEKNHG